jgi:hypothetical protein
VLAVYITRGHRILFGIKKLYKGEYFHRYKENMFRAKAGAASKAKFFYNVKRVENIPVC